MTEEAFIAETATIKWDIEVVAVTEDTEAVVIAEDTEATAETTVAATVVFDLVSEG